MQKGQKGLKKLNITKFGQVLILFSLFSVWTFAQTTVVVPTPKTRQVQKTPKTPKTPQVSPVDSSDSVEQPVTGGMEANDSDFPVEKYIKVDGKVNVQFCVSEGNLKVNGWNRDEVRVFVKEGSKAAFKIIKKNGDNLPNWIAILGYEPIPNKRSSADPCLSGETIEVDVPKGSTIKLEGREATIKIDSVNKVSIKNNEGDISLSQIEQVSEVKTWEGNISIENSRGSIVLDSINGNILAYEVNSEGVGDTFKAKTNGGTIVLQSVNHPIIEAYSISGSIKYSGEISSEGQYTFSNTSGNILLSIPKTTSSSIEITCEKGRFASEMPMQNISEKLFYPSMQTLIRKLGEGEAIINLTTQSGFIKIKKLD